MIDDPSKVPLTVRTIVALDLWGRAGAPRRRAIVRVEFWLSCVGCAVVGALFLSAGAPWELVCGAWLVGVAANYFALALLAESLLRHRLLERELEGSDLDNDLRRATRSQILITLPFIVAVATIREQSGRS